MHASVSQLTLEEKAGLVSGASFWSTRAVERVGVRSAILTDGPHGVRYQSETGDHLGIFDSEPATSFPTAAATGSSWDPELLAEMGRALGIESRALGVDVLLGPGVNMKRSPLCGRNFEYFSEDPLLAGVLGAAWVNGIQSQGVGASVKHYAANNQETDRMRVSADVDERALREIYFPAFERVVTDAQPATIMCSYNKVNGVYASQNRWLLHDVLREDWGFDGYVVSDWGAVVDPIAALAAGTDLAMPGTGEAGPRPSWTRCAPERSRRACSTRPCRACSRSTTGCSPTAGRRPPPTSPRTTRWHAGSPPPARCSSPTRAACCPSTRRRAARSP
jgi:beta-glucosidase